MSLRTYCADSQPAPPDQALEWGSTEMGDFLSADSHSIPQSGTRHFSWKNSPWARPQFLVILHGSLNIGEAVLFHLPVLATGSPQSSRGSCLVIPQCVSHRTTSYRH